MIKDETWSVSIQRARTFFREQADVEEESGTSFRFRNASIQLTERKPKGMGVWAAQRVQVTMEGPEEDVQEIYHRFFIRFLSTGG